MCHCLCNQRGAFWVHVCPAVRTQWTTPLMYLSIYICERKLTHELRGSLQGNLLVLYF